HVCTPSDPWDRRVARRGMPFRRSEPDSSSCSRRRLAAQKTSAHAWASPVPGFGRCGEQKWPWLEDFADFPGYPSSTNITQCDQANLARLLQHRRYQTLHAWTETIGSPAWQPKACWNSFMFCTTPLVRNWPGECGSVMARTRELASVAFSHQTCAKPRKNCC